MRVLIRWAVTVAIAAASLQAIAIGAASAAGQRATAPQTRSRLVYRGTVNLHSLGIAAKKASPGSVAGRKARQPYPLAPKTAQQPAVPVPNPLPTQILSQPGRAQGFVGLTTADSGGVNGFDVEPPDQGLCAHSGVQIEAVNLALRVYTESHMALTPTISLNSFFGLPPAFDSTRNTFGPFLSDPRCYYDAQTGRWFVTVLQIDVNPYSGSAGVPELGADRGQPDL